MTERRSKETETTKVQKDDNIVQRIVYTVFGLVMAVLGFRLVFRLLGANPDNVFVRSIYSITQPIVGIFEGILPQSAVNGPETTAVFEPATVIAMLVVALIAWIVLRLITPRKGQRVEKTEYTEERKPME